MNGSRELINDKDYKVKSFEPILDKNMNPHTLIVGTMPSITSHGLCVYYGHASNAFWWITGEALGFRRGGPYTENPWPNQFKTKPAKDIIAGLTRTEAPVLSYPQQVQCLTSKGYALWDVVKECRIKNSDDTSIKQSVPNNIPGLLEEHPTIKKIVFASGKTSAKIFSSLNRSWLMEKEFYLRDLHVTSACFPVKKMKLRSEPGPGVIELVVPHSVSPACANVRFTEKRDQWLKQVFSADLSSFEYN